jgi:hypothetical protein
MQIHIDVAQETLHCAFPHVFPSLAGLDIASEQADHRGTKELRRVEALADLLLDGGLLLRRATAVIADANARDAQAG